MAGHGGGLYLMDHGATLHNVFIEDNAAEFGPDCFSDADPGPSDFVTSLGGVVVSNTIDCLFAPAEGDIFNNLLSNGSFEIPAANLKFPAYWTPKNITKDKLNCNGQTPFGYCALMFKGSAKEKASFTQTIPGTSLSLDVSDTLKLYAAGRGGKASKVILTATVVYSTPGQAANKAKSPSRAARRQLRRKTATLTVLDSAVTAFRSRSSQEQSGKSISIASTCSIRPVGPAARCAAAPAAPSGFRGNN